MIRLKNIRMKNEVYLIALFLVFAWASCVNEKKKVIVKNVDPTGVELVVLGTVQDGGAPHIGCKKDCCKSLWESPNQELQVVSLGIIDHDDEKHFVVEASPDFSRQAALLAKMAGKDESAMPDGILITHAHIGHYTGLMFLGREAKGAKQVPVYAMPKMANFLSTNGPWSQLVALENIKLMEIENENKTQLTSNLEIQPIRVPHRDEYSETVGFIIEGKTKRVLFIPDIDKWSKWDQDIKSWIQKVDYAFLDATFYDGEEINNRNIAEIPHPFVIESMDAFDSLTASEKAKVHFIHLNHTNPLLNRSSNAYQTVVERGYKVAKYGSRISL